MHKSLLTGFTLTCVIAASASTSQESATPLPEAARAFWSSKSLQASLEASRDLVVSGASVQQLAELLANATTPENVATGRYVVELETSDGTLHPSLVIVPAGYDSSRDWPVRIYLHGGVARDSVDPEQIPWRGDADKLIGDDWISVFPHGWSESLWWQRSQAENLANLVRYLKSTYRVDDDRVYLMGVSDGGTGGWYQAAANPTPFAAFLLFNSNPGVLGNLQSGVDHDFYPFNLLNRPLFLVNGGQDRLYPSALLKPLYETFAQMRIDLTFVDQPEAGHNTAWWPELEPTIERFVADHARTPLPDKLFWRQGEFTAFNRIHWLILEQIGNGETSELDNYNPLYDAETGEKLFPRREASGRALAVYRDNRFVISTQNVERIHLLLSPDMVDFSKPVIVDINTTAEVYNGLVEQSAETLLKWAAIDRDRRQFYTAELVLDVP